MTVPKLYILLLLVLAFGTMTATPAVAEIFGCPTDQVGPNPRKPVTKPIGQIESQTHFAIALGEHAMNAKGWNFRARSILFGAHSAGPVHSHARQPEFVMVKHGTIVLEDTHCKVPIVLQEGQVYHAGAHNEHWGVNPTGNPVIVYIVDLLDDKELAN